jgi:phosphoenolpyruvate carboxylase
VSRPHGSSLLPKARISTRREVQFAPKDAQLRDDVRTLGALVGDVLREQCGEGFFQLVERARQASIAGADDDLHALIENLPPRDAETLVRAFSTYFEVVNLAERIHRIRRRRDYLRSASDPQEGSLQATAGQLAAAGITGPQVATLLQRLRVEPVFTAHPTEATRRTLLEKEQVIGRLLVERLDPSLTPDEERAASRAFARKSPPPGRPIPSLPRVRPSWMSSRTCSSI